MFARPDSGVTVWLVRLILDPPAPTPPFNHKTAITTGDPVDEGEPDRWWKLRGGGFPLSCSGAFTHLTQQVTQLLGFEMKFSYDMETSL